MESLLWAQRETNIAAYVTSLVPEMQQDEATRLQRESKKGISELFFHEGNHVSGFQLLNTTALSDDEASVTFLVAGQDQLMKIAAKRIGNDWKLYSAPTF